MSLENPEKKEQSDKERILQLEEEVKNLRVENKQLREAATTDHLTNILNRRGLDAATKDLFAQRGRSRENGENREQRKPIGVLALDIDNFKVVNDAFTEGHAGGDRILREAADFLKDTVRGSDIVARTGGEEFVIVFNNANAQDIYNKFFDHNEGRSRLSFVAELDGEKIPINFSGGISMFGPDETIGDLDAVLRRADTALYVAKEDEKTEDSIMRGRDRMLVYNEEMVGAEKDE
jgi:diguanylate cyclase (GGDEF)-like protein